MRILYHSTVLVILVALCSACTTRNHGILPADTPITIVAFGDSITAARRAPETGRWPALLQVRLLEALPGRDITVINSGVGGNTSRDGLARIEADVLAYSPDIVLVEFGGNDATPDSKRHVSLAEFRGNMTDILASIRAHTSARIVLLTFPPVIDEWHSWGTNPFFTAHGGADAYVEQYRIATRAFANHHNLPLIDIDRALRTEINHSETKNIIRSDGIHLTAEGNKILAREIARGLLPVPAK